MAENMGLIVDQSFPNASKVIDRFHVQKLAFDAVQEIRIKHRWETIDLENQMIQIAKKTDVKHEVKEYSNGDSFKQLFARSICLIFRSESNTINTHYENILNYFDNRSTNASAESFNSKIKAFRTQFRGVRDIDFFLFRLENLFA